MSTCFRVLAAASVLAAAATDASAQRARIPTQQSLKALGLERMFLARAQIDSGRDATALLSGDEEVVFLVSKSGVVTAFDAESGRRMWTQLAGGRTENVSAVVTDIDAAYVVIGERLYAFDKLSGSSLWSLRIPFIPVAAPVFDEERMYVGTLDGSVYAFELATVREYAAIGDEKLNQFLQETIAWRYRVGGHITSAPVISDDALCFTSDNGSLFSLKAESRDEYFQYETDRSVSAPLVADDGLLFMAGLDASLYAIDIQTGQTRWEFVSGRSIRNPAIVIAGHVYLTPTRDGLYRIDRDSGVKEWQAPTVTQFLAASDDRVYARDTAGSLEVIDGTSGDLVGQLPLRGFSVGLQNEKTDRIYVATPDGVLMAMREIGREFATFHNRPKLKPILPPLADASGEN
ncbi:MAG: PQQ-binding-like beta-propeller repeat protein [Planctomycetota bacterium]